MLSKATNYAIWILVYMKMENEKGNTPGVKEISLKTGGPRFYIAKVLQQLVAKGIIKSAKGKGGGYSLDKNRPEITLKELLQEDETKKNFSSCVLGLKSCSSEMPCSLYDKWCLIMKDFDYFISTVTIQSIAEEDFKF